jgi:hypothetical protein
MDPVKIRPARPEDASAVAAIGLERRHGRLDGEWRDCVPVERLLGEAEG